MDGMRTGGQMSQFDTAACYKNMASYALIVNTFKYFSPKRIPRKLPANQTAIA